MTEPRIAILGPCHTEPFEEHLSLDGSAGTVPPGMGGYNITHLALARLARGLRTDVITCDPSVSSTCRFEGPLLRLWVTPRRQRHMLRDLYRHERRLLREAIKEADPDCLHANWAGEYALAASAAGYPWILSLHDNPAALIRWIGIRHIIPFLLAIWLTRRAPLVTGVSPHACSFARRFAWRTASCIPNLLHMPLLSPATAAASGSQTTAKNIVAVLNWSAFKNTKRALLAFKALRQERSDVELQLLGPGLGSGGPAEDWARTANAAEGVAFLGIEPYAACIARIRAADVLFHPALEEAMGCQVAEAMVLDTHVVCAQQAKGPAWLTNQGQCSTMVDGCSVQAMAQALSEVLDRPTQEMRGINAAAREFALELTDAESILRCYGDAYASAIKQAC